MADGPNTNSGSKVASALNSIPFGNIIGGPLAACVRAQAEAAHTTIDFIRGFTIRTRPGRRRANHRHLYIHNEWRENTHDSAAYDHRAYSIYAHRLRQPELHSGYHCMRRRKDGGEICYGRLYTHRGRRAIGIC